MVNDCEHDIAILRVNLKNVSTRRPLSLFAQDTGDLATASEKVISIGSSAVPISLASKDIQEAKDGLTKTEPAFCRSSS